MSDEEEIDRENEIIISPNASEIEELIRGNEEKKGVSMKRIVEDDKDSKKELIPVGGEAVGSGVSSRKGSVDDEGKRKERAKQGQRRDSQDASLKSPGGSMRRDSTKGKKSGINGDDKNDRLKSHDEQVANAQMQGKQVRLEDDEKSQSAKDSDGTIASTHGKHDRTDYDDERSRSVKGTDVASAQNNTPTQGVQGRVDDEQVDSVTGPHGMNAQMPRYGEMDGRNADESKWMKGPDGTMVKIPTHGNNKDGADYDGGFGTGIIGDDGAMIEIPTKGKRYSSDSDEAKAVKSPDGAKAKTPKQGKKNKNGADESKPAKDPDGVAGKSPIRGKKIPPKAEIQLQEVKLERGSDEDNPKMDHPPSYIEQVPQIVRAIEAQERRKGRKKLSNEKLPVGAKKDSVKEYLQRHKIKEMFDMFLTALLSVQPDRPVDFLHDMAREMTRLRKIEKKANQKAGPCPCTPRH